MKYVFLPVVGESITSFNFFLESEGHNPAGLTSVDREGLILGHVRRNQYTFVCTFNAVAGYAENKQKGLNLNICYNDLHRSSIS